MPIPLRSLRSLRALLAVTPALVAASLPAQPAHADEPRATPQPAPAVSPATPAQPASPSPLAAPSPTPVAVQPPPVGTPPPPWQYAGPGPAPYPDPRAYEAYDENRPGGTSGRRWYGWQTLAVMGGSSVFIPLPFLATDGTFLVIPVAGFLLGGPIVHWGHGHVGRGFAVLGMHFGITAGGTALGAVLGCAGGGCSGGSSGLAVFFGGMLGACAGLLSSNIIDVAVLAYDDHPAATKPARQSGSQLSILPSFDVSPTRATLGLGGKF